MGMPCTDMLAPYVERDVSIEGEERATIKRGKEEKVVVVMLELRRWCRPKRKGEHHDNSKSFRLIPRETTKNVGKRRNDRAWCQRS